MGSQYGHTNLFHQEKKLKKCREEPLNKYTKIWKYEL